MERLGRYELLQELGRGAMGVVYKARDPGIDRLVAIKVMVPAAGLEVTQVKQWQERFQREARAAGRLAHPSIVTVHDVGEEQGRAFLVMEFIEGQTLEGLLRERRVLPLDQVANIGEQVAHALDYAHRHGIVHRDIKPANILLTADGIAKVTDLGIVRFTGAQFTQTGHILGTPSYMSPEQIAGLKVDGRSDIFSLGAVLYELLTGERAFHGETLSTIAYRIIHEDPTPLRRLNPAFPAALDACLKKALAKDPARRYARADDLARDLRGATETEPVPAPPPPTVTATRLAPPRPRPPQRSPTPRWLWLAGGGVAVAGIGLALAVWLRPPQQPPVATPVPLQLPATPSSKAAEEDAQRKAEAERLAAERQRIEEEKARLAQQQAALEAARKQAADEAARQKAVAEAEAKRKAELEREAARREVPHPPRGVVNRFQFTGNTVISTQELEGLVRDRLGQPMTREEYQAVANRVTEHYHSRGYFLARAQARPPDLREGIFGIEVAEGRVGRLRVGPLLQREAPIVEAAFAPVIRKGVVEKAALGAAIKFLAERRGLVVRLRLEPGGAPGTLDLVVQKSWSGQVEIQLPGDPAPKLLPLKGRQGWRPGG